MTSSPRLSLFDRSAQSEQKLAIMREQAMEAEVRRYIRLEAKERFKGMLQDVAEENGTTIDILQEEPKRELTLTDKLDYGITMLFDLPRLAIILTLNTMIIGFTGWLIYKLWFK